MSGQQHAPAALYPRERPGTHFTGGWVGPRADRPWDGKSRPNRNLIPDRPARSSVTIPTELPGPLWLLKTYRLSREVDCLHLQGLKSFFCDCSDPEYADSKLLRNVGIHFPVELVSYPRRLET